MVPPIVRVLGRLHFRCRPTLRVPTTRTVAFGVRLLCNRLPRRHLPLSRPVPIRSCLSRLRVIFRLPRVRPPHSTCAARPYSERWPPSMRSPRPPMVFGCVVLRALFSREHGICDATDSSRLWGESRGCLYGFDAVAVCGRNRQRVAGALSVDRLSSIL